MSFHGKHTQETKDKIINTLTGLKQSQETCDKKSKSLKGKNIGKIRTKEVCENKSQEKLKYYETKDGYWLGKKRSEETNEKNRISHTGLKQSKETCNKKSKSMKGKNVGKIASSVAREKLSISHNGKHLCKESRIRRNEKMQLKKEAGIIKISNSGKSFDTIPELIMKDILNKAKLEFIPQKYIKQIKGYVDFYLSKYNLIIEVDGDYPHANPKFYKTDKLIYGKYTAKEKWEYDKNRTSQLEKLGYKVLRIWEDDIKNNIGYVNNIILEKIK